MTDSTKMLMILGFGGLAVYLFTRRPAVVMASGPTVSAQTGAGPVYVPPPQAVPVDPYTSRPSSAAPGAAAWGYVPQPPTGAQQAAQVISAIGGLIGSVGSAYSDFSDS